MGYDVKKEVTDKYSLRGRVFQKLREDILSGKYEENEELKEVAIGEELGLIGCMAALLILAAIVVRCLVVAGKAKTPLEAYICVGMAAMLIFQTIINVGMCLFLMPVIGLTLPFFSYGGSSLVTLYAAMGVVSGIQKRSLPEWLR